MSKQKILVPLDGSELGESVLPWVKLVASKDEVELTLLRAYYPAVPIQVTPELTLPAMDTVVGESVEHVDRYLESTAADLGIADTTMESFMGDASDGILQHAENYDLVIMASHGRGGLGRWLLGSVATKVVRGCTKPVLVVGARSQDNAPKQLKKILVPLDGSSTAEAALKAAAHLARAHQAELILFRGLLTAGVELSGPEVLKAKQWEMGAAEEYLQSIKDSFTGFECQTVVSEHAPVRGILEAAKQFEVDLVAMGSHGRSGVERWLLGSVTEAVLQKSDCPILVVREAG